MKRLLLALLVLWLSEAAAFATWSVIAANQRTSEVAIASATCVSQDALASFPATSLMDIQAIVVPGRAVAAAQAFVDRTRQNQRLMYRELQKGTPPEDIIRMLREDPDVETRQFGIVDLRGRMAGFSGAKNGPVSLHRYGQAPGEPIFYAVQGNILASEAVVHEAVEAFVDTSGELTDRVMAAMDAADRNGGDRRCTCESEPQIDAPCDGKTAHVAYVLKADRNDATGQSFNDGTYTLYISVTDKDIEPTENANPVKTLHMRYDAWKRTRGR